MNKLKAKSSKRTATQGLTLVESLVAITVLLIGVIGPLEIAARGIGDGIFARNQIAANYLAQEAIELVVNQRNALARQAQYDPPPAGETIFDDPKFNECIVFVAASLDNYCQIDALTGDITGGGEGACTAQNKDGCKLVFDTDSYLYRPADTVSNPVGPTFTRLVRILPLDPSHDQVKVSVIIEWFNKSITKTLTIVEHLFSKG